MTWKAVERRIAARLGGERVPVTDKRSNADVVSDTLAVEVKHRKTLPKWLHKAMKQATDAATDEQLPIAVLHQLGQNSDNDFVVMRLADFEKLAANNLI